MSEKEKGQFSSRAKYDCFPHAFAYELVADPQTVLEQIKTLEIRTPFIVSSQRHDDYTGYSFQFLEREKYMRGELTADRLFGHISQQGEISMLTGIVQCRPNPFHTLVNYVVLLNGVASFLYLTDVIDVGAEIFLIANLLVGILAFFILRPALKERDDMRLMLEAVLDQIPEHTMEIISHITQTALEDDVATTIQATKY
jgi:hypothetical protein